MPDYQSMMENQFCYENKWTPFDEVMSTSKLGFLYNVYSHILNKLLFKWMC